VLEDLNEVEDVILYVNFESYTIDGITPRTIRPVILGGNDDDIAEALYKTTSLKTQGSSSGQFTHHGHTYTVYFDRPSDTGIDVSVTMLPVNSNSPAEFPNGGESEVKAAVKAFVDSNRKIGASAIPQQIANAASIISGYYVSEVLIDGQLEVKEADQDERFVISSIDDVEVTVSI
jgi:hypothetical protein